MPDQICERVAGTGRHRDRRKRKGHPDGGSGSDDRQSKVEGLDPPQAHQRDTDQGTGDVAEALPRPVPAEVPAQAFLPGQASNRSRGRRRERRRGSTLSQPGHGEHDRGWRDQREQGSDGERDEPAKDHGLRTDSVAERAEEGFEDNLGHIVEREHRAEPEQGQANVVTLGTQYARDAVRTEGSGKPGQIQRCGRPHNRRFRHNFDCNGCYMTT
ncbi:hypothetical protein SDC9_148002 [bioreactor metagenome]|uniref:Uncharacterized protein n=1 Tax=bioreactor metagenome TaxID=1076179 RepID=A0A645EJB7_9ZZZZ